MIRMTEGLKMTDNLHEFRKFVLKDLIKEGYKYIARDKDGAIFAYSRKPNRQDEAWYLDEALNDDINQNISLVSRMLPDIYQNISLVSRIFPDIEWEKVEPFRIPYTNWKEVPVDTPVVYTSATGKNYALHFCKYDKKNDRVVLYTDGRTSFSEQGVMETYPERVSIYKQGEKLNDGNISNN